MPRRILYVQFSDPAAYPPIEHSSHILAEKGWAITFLGVNAFSVSHMKLSMRPGMKMVLLSLKSAGGNLGFEYVIFLVRFLYLVYRWRPDWIYASDPLVIPAVYLIRLIKRIRTCYHEHDSPNVQTNHSRFAKIVMKCRNKLAKDAEICILPQRERVEEFIAVTGRQKTTICVWNCPRLSELEHIPIVGSTAGEGSPLILYFHGSINKERLPTNLIRAASRFKGSVRMRIAGYEVPDGVGHIDELSKIATENGAPGIIEFLGVISPHERLLQSAACAHVGLSLMPRYSEEINLRHMVGASNKSFDYMACGLPLLVTDSPDWISTFVEPGYARACDPLDVCSIEAQLRWYLDNPDLRLVMGKRCAMKIRGSWNYDSMFAEVFKKLGQT